MVGPEVQIGGRYCPHSPFCLGGEGLPLIVGGSGDNDLISMLVDSACGGGRYLALLLCLLLYFCYLLPLLGGGTDFHPQDDISDF